MLIKNVKHQIELLVKAFELGIKDVLEIQDVHVYGDLIEHLKDKDYLWERVESQRGGTKYFFFKKESDLIYFKNNLLEYVKESMVSKISTQYGLFMGYPPKACEFFPKKSFGVSLIENIIINYNGMAFASYVETIEEDLEWLFKNKPLDSNSFVLIEGTAYKTNKSNWKENLLGDLEYYKTTGLKMKLDRASLKQ